MILAVRNATGIIITNSHFPHLGLALVSGCCGDPANALVALGDV
jgi:hypothetical protein